MQRAAIYQVFVRDFSPSGDFRGLIAGLDRIEASGANTIWLMPIHPIGRKDRKGTLGSPYAATDHAEYWEQIESLLDAHSAFRREPEFGGPEFPQPPDAPLTNFEDKYRLTNRDRFRGSWRSRSVPQP